MNYNVLSFILIIAVFIIFWIIWNMGPGIEINEQNK